MRINVFLLEFVGFFLAAFFRPASPTISLPTDKGSEVRLLLKQHPDIFAKAYQDKVFLQTYGALSEKSRLLSQPNPTIYPSHKTERAKTNKVHNPNAITLPNRDKENLQSSSSNDRLSTKSEEEFVYVKLLPSDTKWNDIANPITRQSVIDYPLGKNLPLIKNRDDNDEGEDGSPSSDNTNQEVLESDEIESERVANAGEEINERNESLQESESDEKEREGAPDLIKSETHDKVSSEATSKHQDEDPDSYAPFEVVVQVRERKSERPLISREITESGKDMYRSKGYKETNYRKIERLEETQYFEEEWDRQKKLEVKENGKIRDDIAKHYAKHPGAGHPEIAGKGKIVNDGPTYKDTYKYHAPFLSKDFKINDDFRNWVLAMESTITTPKSTG